MKKIVKLTEADLARIVRRVIREQEEVSGDVEMEIEDMDENDATALERFVDKVGDGIKKLNSPKLKKMLRIHSRRSPKIKRAFDMCKW